MEVIIGKTAGFCYGVKRAVNGSIQELEQNKEVYCLGELVHNKQVTEELEKKGIKFADNINDLKNCKTIIRAHGVEERIYKLAKNRGIELIDFTCPNVLKIHQIAKRYKEDGYYIFLIGTENHPETIGTISYCGDRWSLITCEEDIEIAINKLKKAETKKLLLISQTTFSINKFEKIEKLITEKISKDIEITVKNTICMATELRQKETKQISQEVDMIIIIGGKNSSNTKKLYEIACENCKKAICIETKDELEINELQNIKKVGIMAGASTPQKSIEEVVTLLKKDDRQKMSN